MQHGKGREYYQNGDIFDGYFRQGKAEGNNGTYSYVDGARLEGTWANGKAVLAECTYFFKDGEQFEGKWPEKAMDAKSVQQHVSSST